MASTAKTVLALFDESGDVEAAIQHLESDGYNPKDVSIVAKNRDDVSEIQDNTGADVAGSAVSGATTGAIIGGLAGLVSAIVLPGLGAFFIGGPIVAALGLSGAAATTVSGAATGALAGGLLGALMGFGLSEDDARVYETRINEGAILVAVPAYAEDLEHIREVLEDNNAADIRTISQAHESFERREIRHKNADKYVDEDHTQRSHHATHGHYGFKGGTKHGRDEEEV